MLYEVITDADGVAVPDQGDGSARRGLGQGPGPIYYLYDFWEYTPSSNTS